MKKHTINEVKSSATLHRLVLLACLVQLPQLSHTAELNKALPSDDLSSRPINLDLPAQSLSTSLKQYSELSGIDLSFDSNLTKSILAPAIKGRLTRKEALQKLLNGSGLTGTIEGDSAVIKKAVEEKNTSLALDKVEVRAKRFYEVGPLPGLGLTKEEIPGNVQSISAKEIKESHSLSLTDLMNSKLQSVNVNDYQSNPFQMDLQYRGFTASPQLGTAQGISVFLDGIRVNEPFGDVVNWDMIPLNALSGLDVFPGSNPIFGLGTLGGALAMRTKSGFDGKSLDAEILTGSFGRKQLQISAGDNNGVIAGFVSGNFFMEDGWRQNSPSKVNQVFGKAEWQNDQARLGLSMLYAGNKLTGNGLLPEQMVDQNPRQVYTSPDKSKNDLLQFQLSGIWDVTDTFNITGQIYNRKSKRKTKTTDVNENFNGPATVNSKTQQLLPGYSDINNDGLPDYNTFTLNVAAGPDGRALDINGIAEGDLGFDINNLAIGTNFRDPAVAGQDMVQASDGSGPIPRWTIHPRVISESLQYNWNDTATTLGVGQFNNPLPTNYYNMALEYQQKIYKYPYDGTKGVNGGNFVGYDEYGNQVPLENRFTYNVAGFYDLDNTFVDDSGFLTRLVVLNPVNAQLLPSNVFVGPCAGMTSMACLKDSNGFYIDRDGAYSGKVNLNGTIPLGQDSGIIEGTPTALISNTQIDQLSKGAALQLNWNLDSHKFMVGASIDKANASYASGQYLGLLDADRNGYSAPNELGYEYIARDAASAISLNDFGGNSVTKSIYASETWKPIESLSVTASGRLNWTKVKNQIDVNSLSKYVEASINSLRNNINPLTLCRGVDTDGNGLVDATECPNGVDGAIVPFDPADFYDIGQLESTAPEKFTYKSFNPSLGFTWQANDKLNVYGNLSRGARTPTVIELGCAYDDTLVALAGTNPTIYQERSLADRRTCNLPTTMSGDPYLKQVRSKSMEVGARGLWGQNIEWNVSFYKTDLTDDIYFVSIAPSRSFFQNIGDTRRQGMEMGFKGKWGRASFGVNYALTDATFQSAFKILSPYNSSANSNAYSDTESIIDGRLVRTSNFQTINVEKGNRIPGVPLHNLNFNFAYEITDNWRVGLNAVMHSESFVRGNENNKHRAGPATALMTDCFVDDPANPGSQITTACAIPRTNWRPGQIPGYTVFNLQSSYKLTPAWTLGMQINNVFDTQYASAGRLGLNAFSPATYGAVGASGFNYNSSEWQGTSFLGIGAPRSIFVTLSYEFQPDKKADIYDQGLIPKP